MQEVCIFSGSSHHAFAKEISDYIGLESGKIDIKSFPDGETFVQIQENVRGKTCFIVQSLAHNPNTYLMELLIIIDALKRASAQSIIALIPYLAYARQDRKDNARVPITARLVANLIEKAGADRVVTMDLHVEQLQGFFDIPTDHLIAKNQLVHAFENLNLQAHVVAAPDIGSIKYAKKISEKLDIDLVMIDKKRYNAQQIKYSPIIGEVNRKNVLLVDDVCSTAETLCQAAKACKEAGALSIYAMVAHGVFASKAIEKIERSQIEKLIVSNSIAHPWVNHPKIEVVSVARIFGEAIHSIMNGSSILSLFGS